MKTFQFIVYFLLLSNFAISQTCSNYIVKQGNSGLSAYEAQVIQDAACILSDGISVPMNADAFKIYSYDFYTPLAYAEPDLKFELSYKHLEEDLKSIPYYFIIVREHIALDEDFHMLGDKEIKYVVRLKLPNIAPYIELNEIEIQSIENLIEEELNLNPKEIVNSGKEADVISGIMARIDSQLGAANIESFLQAGFDSVNVSNHYFEIQVNNQPYINSAGTVIDYSGTSILSNSETINFGQLLEVGISASAPLPSSAFIVTSNLMINFDAQINDAESMYNSSDKSSVIWLHFESSPTGTEIIYKTKVNWSLEKSLEHIDNIYEEKMAEYWDITYEEEDEPITVKGEDNSSLRTLKCETVDCNFSLENIFSSGAFAKQWRAYCCIVENGTCEIDIIPGVNETFEFQCGISSGVLDGLWETLLFLVDVGSGLQKASPHTPFTLTWISDLAHKAYTEGSFTKALKDKWGEDKKFWTDIAKSIKGFWDKRDEIKAEIVSSVLIFLENLTFQKGIAKAGYSVGKIIFEVILTYFTGGSKLILGIGSKISSFTKGAMTSLKSLAKNPLPNVRNIVSSSLNKIKNSRGETVVKLKCIGGCFVKDTPVLMAGNANQFSLRNSTKAMAVAAAMPIVAVPIQEVQLLDYTVAHETVNSTYGLTASMDDDIYLGFMDKDPYTSDQQIERDEYKINDTDWHEVVFEQVKGSSTAKLALHNDWILQKGYDVEGVVNLDLPEQGINGPFRITSIKHIIPQKKPTFEDESDDYGYKPVTALFTHESNQVYNIDFDSGESLGITYQHPIYSTTAGDWKLAGELEIGEKVLTKEGEATVASSAKKGGSEIVYNLEVKELHNFLVGESGVVVHNSYAGNLVESWDELLKKLFFDSWEKGLKAKVKSAKGTLLFSKNERVYFEIMDWIKKNHFANDNAGWLSFASHSSRKEYFERWRFVTFMKKPNATVNISLGSRFAPIKDFAKDLNSTTFWDLYIRGFIPTEGIQNMTKINDWLPPVANAIKKSFDRNGIIHFHMDEITDLSALYNPSNPFFKGGTITELRYLIDNGLIDLGKVQFRSGPNLLDGGNLDAIMVAINQYKNTPNISGTFTGYAGILY